MNFRFKTTEDTKDKINMSHVSDKTPVLCVLCGSSSLVFHNFQDYAYFNYLNSPLNQNLSSEKACSHPASRLGDLFNLYGQFRKEKRSVTDHSAH